MKGLNEEKLKITFRIQFEHLGRGRRPSVKNVAK